MHIYITSHVEIVLILYLIACAFMFTINIVLQERYKW